MEKLNLYIRYELTYFIILNLFLSLPLAILFQFSTFDVPGFSYAIIGCLFLFLYVFYKPKERQKALHPIISDILNKKNGKVPSHKEVQKLAITISEFRIGTIITTSLVILILSIIYDRL